MSITTSAHYIRVKGLKQLKWLCWSKEETRTIVLKIRQDAKSTKEIAYWPRRNGRNWYLLSHESPQYYTENQLRTQTKVLDALERGNLFLQVGAFDDYWPVCPSCGHDGMTVVQITLTYVGDGEPIDVRIPLETHGFNNYDTCVDLGFDEKADFSTEDEVVECNSCGKQFSLSELMIEHEIENR
jgi:hypothetical protein